MSTKINETEAGLATTDSQQRSRALLTNCLSNDLSLPIPPYLHIASWHNKGCDMAYHLRSLGPSVWAQVPLHGFKRVMTRLPGSVSIR